MNPLVRVAIQILIILLVYGVGEVLAHFAVFRTLNKRYARPKPNDSTEKPAKSDNPKLKSRAQEKGHFERAMLTLGLAAGFPQILIAFGALKVGTFFKDDNDSKVSSDYYLIGNVVSISISILYVLAWKEILNCIDFS